MILDIGPRQSGKTTRLLEAMAQYLEDNPDKTALLVTNHNRSRQELKKRITEYCGDCMHRVITSHKMLPPKPRSTMKQFVDEFGGMSNDKLVVDPEAYYCSSYYPDFDPWPNPTQSMEGYSTKAMEIIDYYNWNTVDRWDMGPKKKIFKHEFRVNK